MSPFDTRSWDWDHSDYSGAAVGDSGPWVWWLPLAWRSVADPLAAPAPSCASTATPRRGQPPRQARLHRGLVGASISPAVLWKRLGRPDLGLPDGLIWDSQMTTRCSAW